ncbi:MAG: ATP-binding protein, partial [Gammaproteobacteria bacterium]|nr:ATP-binding protein [Gammaproteobacteria bacterium]
LQVADNGPGIPPDQIGRLFEKFQQLEGGRSGKRAGTGLGLAISQRIVSHHGGRIQVESAKGEGTTFTIELPVAD